MKIETSILLSHESVSGGYRVLTFEAPDISRQVRPGQFLHIRLPAPADAILRRPFSVFRADPPQMKILFKPVGRGTEAMLNLKPGDELNLLGPLGNGFPQPAADALPILIAGGYGMAALYLQARACPRPGIAFFGGARAGDILCVPDFEALGWNVRVATQDGTLGDRGLVTGPLDRWLKEERDGRKIEAFACGPNGMLRAIADRAAAGDWTAWVSMDRNMGCGVGACLTCVQKIRDPEGGWVWERVCREGPVFDSRTVVWEDEP
ncbi:MAG: dihydroorotate dehydrogenase electron transfer subunit [Kiritimatiellia bacterium]|nr:dihydroorotate dehydrogenase electron transfer subunit [Kiritimatiellia bacterium]